MRAVRKSSREKETKRGATVLLEAVYTCKQERKEIDKVLSSVWLQVINKVLMMKKTG